MFRREEWPSRGQRPAPPPVPPRLLTTVRALVVFYCFLWNTKPLTSQFIEGSVASCRNEGGSVEIPTITDDPCISCMCLKGEVECSREKCPDLEGCHVIQYPKPADQCCESCIGCSYKKRSYSSGSDWTDNKDPCLALSCQAGVVTRSRVRCHVPCKHPVKAKGQCCPVCLGCSFNNKQYREEESFTSPDEPCITCTCTGGSVECKRRACAVLNCLEEFRETPAGRCCPVCRGFRKLFDLGKKRCLFRNNVYSNLQTVHQGSSVLDECTDCICREGTMICDRKVCSPLDCATEDLIVEDGVCCPRCRVPKKKCRYSGKSYKHGTRWQFDTCTSCSCSDGRVHCQVLQCSNEVDCPRNSRLQYIAGHCCPICVDEDAVCAVFGDPHYRTFDGHIYNFQGSCQYVLAQDCANGNFSIRVRNSPRLTNAFAWTKSVVVNIANWRISLKQNLKVKVGGQKVKLPYEQPGLFAVIKGGHTVTLKTTLGVKVIWDGDSYAEIAVAPMYKNKMCGLCGNYNGIESDDLTGKNGVLYLDANDFGNTWRIGRGGTAKNCSKQSEVLKAESPCKRSRKRQLRAEAECSAFQNEAFSDCKTLVNVEPYVKSCQVDVCDCPKRKDCHCESVIAYQRACEREGVTVPEWRAPNTCGAPGCPKGATFNICASACPKTCSNWSETVTCNRPCIPSCQCPIGTVLHKNRCLNPTRCPQNRKTKRRRRRQNKVTIFHGL